jgi:NitT/TauT family transport system ATP-binding protein
MEITEEGCGLVSGDIQRSKGIFARQAEDRAPLVRAILRSLRSTKDGTLGEGIFLDLLRREFSADEVRPHLDIATAWGRYGELFDFDASTGQFTLEHPHHRTIGAGG